MQNRIFIVMFVCLTALSSACGGGGAADNQAACEGWVQQVNSLECYMGSTQLDPGSSCSSYGSTTCDISDYFDCLTANTQCMDVAGMSLPDSSGTASCASLANCD